MSRWDEIVTTLTLMGLRPYQLHIIGTNVHYLIIRAGRKNPERMLMYLDGYWSIDTAMMLKPYRQIGWGEVDVEALLMLDKHPDHLEWIKEGRDE